MNADQINGIAVSVSSKSITITGFIGKARMVRRLGIACGNVAQLLRD